jgi:hypothetical protein
VKDRQSENEDDQAQIIVQAIIHASPGLALTPLSAAQ